MIVQHCATGAASATGQQPAEAISGPSAGSAERLAPFNMDHNSDTLVAFCTSTVPADQSTKFYDGSERPRSLKG